MFAKSRLNLLTQTGLLIGLISLLAIIGIGSSFYITKTIQGAGTTINTSGQLRMLSYKIATQMLRDQQDTEPDTANIEQLIEHFEHQLNHPSLHNSIPKLELNAKQAEEKEELLTLYRVIDRQWYRDIRPLLNEYITLLNISIRQQLPRETRKERLVPVQQLYLSKIDTFVNDISQMVLAIEEQTEGQIQLLHDMELITFPLLLLAILSTPYLFYYKILTPLKDLLQTAEQVRKRNFTRHARYMRKDELGQLAIAFNQMITDLSATYTELEERISDKTEALIKESNRITLMEERNAIAQELHDSLAQSIFYINIQISRISTLLNKQVEEAQTQLRPIVDELKETNNIADQQLRELISTFRVHITPEGIDAAVEEIIHKEGSRANINLTFDNQIQNFNFSHHEEVHLIQIIQEAVSNITKHAQASNGTIRLSFDPDEQRVELQIKDDGIGISENPHRPNHFGLSNMDERAQAIHGLLSITPLHPHGTRVEVSFPPGRSQDNRF